MKIRPECLCAFSKSVKIKKIVSHDFMWFGGLVQLNGLSQKGKFVQVQGPGMVYIDMKRSRTFFKKD